MDPKLIEMLERLSELTDSELKSLDKMLVAEFNRLDKAGHVPENVDMMEQVAEATGRVRAEVSAKQQAAAEADERATKLREQMTVVDGDKGKSKDPDPNTTVGVEDDPTDTPVAQPDATAPTAPSAPTAVAATAGAPGVGDVVPPDAKPPVSKSVVRASASWKSVGAVRGDNTPDRGAAFDSEEQLAMATVEAIDSLGRGSGDPVLIASLVTQFPPERTLGRDPMDNYAKLEAVTGRKSLLASGGICAPVIVDYNVTVGSSDKEPIADGLPDFNATRGGLRFLQTPTFAAVGASGTGIWTAAVDAVPGGATKPIQAIQCGTEQVVMVDAIPTRLRFGNMMARFSPEIVAANTSLALANAARVREVNRLTKISALSTVVSTGKLLGAARDLLATLDLACAAVRYRHRLDEGNPLQAILPRYVKDMIRADFVRELAHDGNNLAISDAEIDALLAAPGRNVRVIWTMDGLAAGSAGGVTFPLQGFGAQATGALLDWPAKLVWYLYPVGTFQRLNGGRLDIGVVRDSVLDSTNDYEVFVEVFEGIAFRGYEATEFVSVLRPSGGSAGTVDTTTY